MLGEALDPRQIGLMAISAFCWEVMRLTLQKLLSSRFTTKVANELGVSIVSSVHAIVACVLCLAIVITENRPQSLYHRFELSQTIYAISTGYFAWDLYFVIFYDFDWQFFLHAASCFLCYLFGQFPFLNYWGVYFLLFELSTPFMHVRKALLVTGNKNSPWFLVVEASFAAMFLLARIVVGFPMSAMVWQDLVDLLTRPHEVHSHFVVYFYLVANTVLCLLNLYWFFSMARKKLLSRKNSNSKDS